MPSSRRLWSANRARNSNLIIFCASLTLAIGPAEARRAEAPRPLAALVCVTETDPVIPWLKAELLVLGFDTTIVVQANGAQKSAPLERIARSVGATAAIRIAAAHDEAEVWVADEATGKIAFNGVVFETSGAEADRLALRVVETLRASLQEAGQSSYPPDNRPILKTELAGSAEQDQAANRSRLSFGGGAALTIGDARKPPVVQLALAANFRIIGKLGLGAIGLVPLWRSRVDGEGGEAEIGNGFAGMGLRFAFEQRQSRVGVLIGAGAGAGFTKVRGHGKNGFVGHEGIVVSAVPYLLAGLSFTATDMLRLRVDLLLGWAVPRTEVRFDERVITTWGHVLITPMLNLEFVVW